MMNLVKTIVNCCNHLFSWTYKKRQFIQSKVLILHFCFKFFLLKNKIIIQLKNLVNKILSCLIFNEKINNLYLQVFFFSTKFSPLFVKRFRYVYLCYWSFQHVYYIHFVFLSKEKLHFTALNYHLYLKFTTKLKI